MGKDKTFYVAVLFLLLMGFDILRWIETLLIIRLQFEGTAWLLIAQPAWLLAVEFLLVAAAMLVVIFYLIMVLTKDE